MSNRVLMTVRVDPDTKAAIEKGAAKYKLNIARYLDAVFSTNATDTNKSIMTFLGDKK